MCVGTCGASSRVAVNGTDLRQCVGAAPVGTAAVAVGAVGRKDGDVGSGGGRCGGGDGGGGGDEAGRGKGGKKARRVVCLIGVGLFYGPLGVGVAVAAPHNGVRVFFGIAIRVRRAAFIATAATPVG